MSVLYPLRMNSKYQTQIEELECMGFDANASAQYLEEHDGNVVRVIDQLLQNKVKDADANDDPNIVDNVYDSDSDSDSDDDSDSAEDGAMEQPEGKQKHDPRSDMCFIWQLPWPLLLYILLLAILLVVGIWVSFLEEHRDPLNARTFNTTYDFEDDVLFGDDEVIIKHIYHYDAYLQLQSRDTDAVVGKYQVTSDAAVWRVQRTQEDGVYGVKLVNKESGKYLRINKGGNEVNAGGNGGKFTLFHATLVEAQQHHFKGVRLQSVKYPQKYVAITSDGSIAVTEDCDANVDCVLIFMTTQRSMQLKNLKNELKVAELQKKIDELKDTIHTLTAWDSFPSQAVEIWPYSYFNDRRNDL